MDTSEGGGGSGEGPEAAREAALRLLAHRPRSEEELRRRLDRKGFADDAIDACIEELRGRGLVDDAAFAGSWVRDRVRLRPRGPSRLVGELLRKGVSRRIAEAAVERVFAEEEVTEAELAREAALAWLRKQGPGARRRLASGEYDERERARRRLYGYLARRGFRGVAVGEAMDAATEAAEGRRDEGVGPGG